MTSFESILDGQIAVLRKNMRLALLFIGALVTVAIAVTAMLISASGTATLETLIKVGPAVLISAIAAIPLKMVVNNRERAAFFEGLLKEVRKADQLTDADRDVLQKLVVDSIKEFAKNAS